MKIMNKFAYLGVLLYMCNIAYALGVTENATADNVQQLIQNFSNNTLQKSTVSKSKLPRPYSYVLTQPLLTGSIKAHYQRTPIINVIDAKQNSLQHTYSRLITMIVDKNKHRNNPSIAQKKNEGLAVELAYITINFDALPEQMIKKILNTTIPFGQLLIENKVQVSTNKRTYFLTPCSKIIAPLLNCQIGSKLYGRTNTIYRADNQQWIAHVTEIMPAMKSNDAN